MSDLISRQTAIDAFLTELTKRERKNLLHTWSTVEVKYFITDMLERLPSAQPERLTDDDFETIRIHLNAYKEKLCNQQRWEEADEYQRIIDRFMAFASAQPEIIRCGECLMHGVCRFEIGLGENGFCSQGKKGDKDG